MQTPCIKRVDPASQKSTGLKVTCYRCLGRQRRLWRRCVVQSVFYTDESRKKDVIRQSPNVGDSRRQRRAIWSSRIRLVTLNRSATGALFISSCPVSAARPLCGPKVLLIYDVTTRPPGTSFDDKTTDFRSEINRIWKAAVRPTFVCAPRYVDKHSSTELTWAGGYESSSHIGPSLLCQTTTHTSRPSVPSLCCPLHVTKYVCSD